MSKRKFKQTVNKSPDVPQDLKAQLDEFKVEERTFDYSYIEFFLQEIERCARGDEWNEILKKRLKDLEPYADIELIVGSLFIGRESVTIKICKNTKKIIHFEHI